MKKRLLCMLTTLALFMALMPEAFATGTKMTDISGHWAELSIQWTVEEGIFSGVGDNMFSPDTPINRGMFVTVLGRLAGIQPADYETWYMESLFSDVPADTYYAPYVSWAVCMGITRGTGDGLFQPEAPVTKEQMAVLLRRFASVYNYALYNPGNVVTPYFADTWTISEFAREDVEALRQIGLLTGSDVDGFMMFSPQENTTRAMAAVMLRRMYESMEPYDGTFVECTDIYVSPAELHLNVGEEFTLAVTVLPEETINKTVTWVSMDPTVASVNLDGTVTALRAGSTRIYAITCNGEYQFCDVTCTERSGLTSSGESYNDKCMRIFGEYVSREQYRYYYSSAEEAESHMVTVTIPAWDFADSSRTTKITKTYSLTVNAAIADSVVAAFEEIYHGKEQFPIHSIGGYRYEPGSEHCLGVAIDINPNENYYISGSGYTVGSYWKPGEDPYSIPLDGEVAQILAKYGFTQGIWSSARDYMHFSYFGW